MYREVHVAINNYWRTYLGDIYPVFMQLLGYAHGITVIIPSDISPDMFGTRSCSIF